MKRRISTVLLAFILAFAYMSFLPCPQVFADETDTPARSGSCGDTATWELDESGTLHISGSGVINWDEWPTESIKRVQIEEGITGIGAETFYGCDHATAIEIPNSVTAIEHDAFSYCTSLKSCTIPAGVTRIEASVFHECSSLTSVTLPDGLTHIGAEAFCGCESLQSISIPEGATDIEYGVFKGCSSLAQVSLPAALAYIPGGMFQGCKSLRSIAIPDSVTKVYGSAFRGCLALEGISLPEGVTEIGDEAFYGCSSLAGICIPAGVGKICAKVFYGCTSLADITLPDGITAVGANAFYNCKSLKTLSLPESVTKIDDGAFEGCSSLEKLRIPAAVKSIGKTVFKNCDSLTGIPVAGTNTAYCSVQGVLFTKDKKTLIKYPNKRSADSYTIPAGVERIEKNAFESSKEVGGIVIPASVTDVGARGFETNFNAVYRGSKADWARVKGEKRCIEGSLKYDIRYCSFPAISSRTYEAKALEPSVTVKDGSTKLGQADYTVTYSRNVNAGQANAVVKGKGDYTGTKTLHFTIKPKAITPKITNCKTLTYNGKNRAPYIHVYDGSKKLAGYDAAAGKGDYTVSGPKQHKDVGKYTAKITLRGNYSGTGWATYYIVPKGTELTALTKSSKQVTVKWKKQMEKMGSARITGYQIQWSTSPAFAKNTHSVKVKGASKYSYQIDCSKWGLKSGTKYYVRVRTYQDVKVKKNGTTVTQSLYSNWCAHPKAVTTAK